MTLRNTAVSLLLMIVVSGCAQLPRPYVPKGRIAPEIVYCNDHTGHKAGSKPWVLDGTCCCTPDDKLMARLHADGFCLGMDAEELRRLYREEEIKLRGPDHQWCNGFCESGPHVVLGGKCMCPPTPGTTYYERIVAGKHALSREELPAS